MCPRLDLEFWVNISAILGFFVTLIGAGIGIYGYLSFRHKWKTKTDALVRYLKKEKEMSLPGRKGQHTARHLIRHVGLTEDEILRISFENKHIQRTVDKDEQGNANALYFEYVD